MVKAVSDGLLPKYGYNPGKYIHALNRDLYNNMFSYFLTALYGVFDFNSEGVNFSFSKGGHQPPIIYRKKEEKVFSISSKGKPIGMFDEDYFDEVSIELNKGDRVFLYTDGLVEASNESMEMLDQTGLENIIMTNYSSDLNKSLEYILAAVNNFMGTDKAQDDIILIAIELI
jgi:sigma-B regulation protein RsbU (phosphoserine phosphatase)